MRPPGRGCTNCAGPWCAPTANYSAAWWSSTRASWAADPRASAGPPATRRPSRSRSSATSVAAGTGEVDGEPPGDHAVQEDDGHREAEMRIGTGLHRYV